MVYTCKIVCAIQDTLPSRPFLDNMYLLLDIRFAGHVFRPIGIVSCFRLNKICMLYNESN